MGVDRAIRLEEMFCWQGGAGGCQDAQAWGGKSLGHNLYVLQGCQQSGLAVSLIFIYSGQKGASLCSWWCLHTPWAFWCCIDHRGLELPYPVVSRATGWGNRCWELCRSETIRIGTSNCWFDQNSCTFMINCFPFHQLIVQNSAL